MGELRVPTDALWGAQTQRAVENFPISGLRMPAEFIAALGLIKAAAATVNADLGYLDKARRRAIRASALRVADGELDSHFPIDVFQTGSGRSAEHTSELQSLMRISYAVFCLNTKSRLSSHTTTNTKFRDSN